jgi:hypothetical protein
MQRIFGHKQLQLIVRLRAVGANIKRSWIGLRGFKQLA